MPSEIQFLSENEQITILPRYSMKKLDLIGVCNNDSEHKNKVKQDGFPLEYGFYLNDFAY